MEPASCRPRLSYPKGYVMDLKVTSRNYDQLIENLISKIKSSATPFADTDPISIARRSSKALEDYEFFASTYFPQHINKPFGAFHR